MKQNGFTLIELMIVVAIIGLIASYALPLYNEYIAKVQVAEGASLVDDAKVRIFDDMSMGLCYSEWTNVNGISDGSWMMGKYSYLKIFPEKIDPSSGTEPNEYAGCNVRLSFGSGTSGSRVSQLIYGKSLTLRLFNNGTFKITYPGTTLDSKYIPNAWKY